MSIRTGKMDTRFSLSVRALSFGFGLALRGLSSAQCQYDVTLIPAPFECPGFGPASIAVFTLNDLGQAAGSVLLCDFRQQPFVWTEERGLVLLPFPPGEDDGTLYDMNNVLGSDGIGQIICNFGPGLNRAYLYEDGRWLPFEVLQGQDHSTAFAINDYSECVGWSSNSFSSPIQEAWLSRAEDGLQRLELPVGPNSGALAVNNHTVITGWMGSSTPTGSHAFLWLNADALDLETIIGRVGSAEGRFVDVHAVVGASTRTLNERGAFETHVIRWDAGEVTVLTDATGGDQSGLVRMNDLGQAIIIAGNDDAFDLFIWQHGQATPLSNLIDLSNFTGFTVPERMNNLGQFCSSIATSEIEYGAIWTPIDRPLGDVNCDCAVDEHDVLDVLRDWGPCVGLGVCPCDLVTSETFRPPGDGKVDAADLAVVLGNWTVPVPVSQQINRRR